MDHLLVWAVIALVVLIFWTTWKWLRKLQLRSRRRGNNYLYQEYKYEDDMDYRAVDLAWESHRENIQNDRPVEKNLELDSDRLNIEEEVDDESWKDYRDNLSLHQAIEGYLNLEPDVDSPQSKDNSNEEYLTLSADYKNDDDFSGVNRNLRQVHSTRENSEAKDDD